jgi:MFS family permease
MSTTRKLSQIPQDSDENDDTKATVPQSQQQHHSNEDFSSALQTNEKPSTPISRPLLLAAVYASISGLLFGYQLGIASGALHSLRSSLELTSSQTESVTSFFFLGLMIASPFGGEACDRFGRRKSILYTNGVFGFASLMLLFAPGYKIILMGRFISGCASGISLVSAVSYLTEVASGGGDHSHRGALVSTVEASVSLGFLVSYLTSYLLMKVIDIEESWRLLFGLGTGLLAFIQWFGLRRMPESPEWLAQMGFHEKANEALRWIGANVDADGDHSSRNGDEKNLQNEYRGASFFSLEACPSIQHYWRQAIIIAFLAIAEQFCGHINIMNYAPVIFAEAFFNYDEEQAMQEGEAVASELLTTTIILGAVKFIVTTFVLFEVDKLGRVFLMKAGAGMVTVSLLLLAIGFTVSFETSFETESGTTEYVYSRFQKAMVLIGCTGCVAGFALSYGPITWLLASELSPSSIRGRMLGFYTVLTHGCAAMVSYTFLSGQQKYGEAAPFWLYFNCSVVSCLFITLAVPETGNVEGGDGEDVETLLDELWFWGDENPLTTCVNRTFADCSGKCNKLRHLRNPRRGEEMGRINSCFDGTDDRSQCSERVDMEFV